MTKIVSVELDPNKDIAKVPAGAIARGVVPAGENLLAIFEVDENAPLKAVEFKYISPNEIVDLEGFTFVGTAAFNDGENISLVYSKEM